MGLRGMNESILIPIDTLRSVQSPTLFLWGSADPFGGAEVAATFAGAVPKSTLEIIQGAGHAPWLDQPTHVARAISGFLDA